MLAGAGYGTAATEQARAEQIYGHLTSNFGTTTGQWIDTCLTWWLASTHNTQPWNPYKVVTVYGGTACGVPFADADLPLDVGNALRSCRYVGAVIWWPSCTGHGCDGGHSVTVWGDSGTTAPLVGNPNQVVIADSDTDSGGDLQTYLWDAYHVGGVDPCRYGDGWYIPYGTPHPYVIQWVALSTVGKLTEAEKTQTAVHSTSKHQDNDNIAATDLHYEVGTDTDILSYHTEIDYTTSTAPTIQEHYVGALREWLDVDWTFDKPVPYCTTVRITTTFVEAVHNAIWSRNIHFTYPDPGWSTAGLGWKIDTPRVEPFQPNMTGGYVVGALSLWSPEGLHIGDIRFQHEYDYDHNPELHTVSLEGLDDACIAKDLKFGHSYGLLDNTGLWAFETWMTDMQGEEYYLVPREPAVIELDWAGRLPYKGGSSYTEWFGWEPEEPSISPDEGFWVLTAEARTWTRNWVLP
ncbi:MAG TPA: hypothetical protein P5525_13780 [Candidatus Paceibacterota bacterium]|nr:hypothetical protein [Candidatus Paceibacterota bacterium]